MLSWVAIFGVLHCWQLARVDHPGEISSDVRAQARWLQRSLGPDDFAFAQKHFPEGELFLYEFYGFALQNIAETTHDPADIEFEDREVAKLLPLVDGTLAHSPFRRMAHWSLRGGICWFAGQNLLRARHLALAPNPDPAEVARFHADSAILADAIARSETGSLEAYPGQTFPVDSLFGYESLQIHDRLYGTRYDRGLAKWENTVKRERDPATGLEPSLVSLDGHALDVPRGCALSWTLAVLPRLDADYAHAQWNAYRKYFGRCEFGLCLFREYAPGHNRAPDSDSGLIVEGLGMSASGFALAAARAEGDVATAEALRRSGELFGVPSISWWGKRYWGGRIAFMDVMALWVRTVPYGPPPSSAAEQSGRDLRPALVLATIYALLGFWRWRVLRRDLAKLRGAREGSFAQRVVFILAVVATVAHLLLPSYVGAWLVLTWTLLGILSSLIGVRSTRPMKNDSLLRAEVGA